jgi:hypothetical protein
MVPIGERRKTLPSLADIVDGAPDLRDLTRSVFGHDDAAQVAPRPDDDGQGESAFPTVRS